MKRLSFCLILALLPACTKSAGEVVSAQDPTKFVGGTPSESRNVVAIGQIVEGKWSESIVPDRESLTAVQFTTATTGWVGSASGSLYRTEDGGVTWKRLDVGNQTGNYLVSLNFVGDKLGWVVFSKYASDYSEYKAYTTRILHTADGGESWSTQYERQQASIDKIRFNQREGWALGLTYESSRSSSHLILHTADSGKHWEDVSEQFARAVGGSASYDFTTDVYSSQVNEATVVTVGGRVVRSDDGGRGWREIGKVEDEFQQTGFMRVGAFPNGNIWVLGGADSKEGIWANLTILSKDNSPIMYRSTQVFLRDAIFLSTANAVACGTVPEHDSDAEKRSAVIAYSSNGARNWSIVYRSSKARKLNILFVLDDHNLWAVGDNGLVVRLQKT